MGVTDFDDGNPEPAIQLVERARHNRIHSYLEISKSKGYHVWALIDSIGRVGDMLDWIIQPNDLEKENYKNQDNKTDINNTHNVTGYSLPVCIRRMLNEGVTFNQRVACFRIAVHLKRVGLPYDAVIAILTNWRLKNHPKKIKEQSRQARSKSKLGGLLRGIIPDMVAVNQLLNHSVTQNILSF